MKNTMTVYTDCNINPCPSGFGEYQRGELVVSPETSFSELSTLELKGGLTAIDDALIDEEFIAAGVRDIRGLIHNEPSRIYCKLEKDYDYVRVAYYGVDETEVSTEFYN